MQQMRSSLGLRVVVQMSVGTESTDESDSSASVVNDE
jgi:hypothetical protein